MSAVELLMHIGELSCLSIAAAAITAACRHFQTPCWAPCAAVPAGGPSGDMDDFEYMLDEMEDYKPAPGEGAASGDSQSDQDAAGAGSDAEREQQQQGGEGDEGEELAAGAAALAEAGSKKAKKKRKRGPKLSALEFEASREMARQIAESPADEQADWLWASYQQVGSYKCMVGCAGDDHHSLQAASCLFGSSGAAASFVPGHSLCRMSCRVNSPTAPSVAADGGCQHAGARRPHS